MENRKKKYNSIPVMDIRFLIVLIIPTILSCNKLVSISAPTDQIVSTVTFSTDDLAEAAVNGIYKTMMNSNYFSRGNVTLYAGMSADELLKTYPGDPANVVFQNKLHIAMSGISGGAMTDHLWTTAYAVIYAANSVILGLEASKSSQLHDSVRNVLIAEAKCIRAFSYFYLVNFYGAVPLILTNDYNAAISMARSSVDMVYKQIVQDLRDAQQDLPGHYNAGKGKRVRVNKWVATALLARTYLYMKEYENAATNASLLIGNIALFELEPELDNVFLINSKEAIWQLNQVTVSNTENPTPEGAVLLPNWEVSSQPFKGLLENYLSPQIVAAFEPNDERQEKWVGSIEVESIAQQVQFCHKYKIGNYNRKYEDPIEYSMVLRLAEQYLIRAEAAANGAAGGKTTAINDLNKIRHRAGLEDLPDDISSTVLTQAIEHEWQTEFFCEWGHRWFNLKRTGKAHDVLSAVSYKQPWAGDYQLQYPIPFEDIRANRNLIQNTGY